VAKASLVQAAAPEGSEQPATGSENPSRNTAALEAVETAAANLIAT
jgi:hypothetical protein